MIIYLVKRIKMIILYVLLIPSTISEYVYFIAKLALLYVTSYIVKMINLQDITMLFYMTLLNQKKKY